LNRENILELEEKVPYQRKFTARDKVSNSNLNCSYLQIVGSVESLSVDHIICLDERKSYLVYVRDILCFVGFRIYIMVTFIAWYSPAHAINPDIYNQLEKYYKNLKLMACNPT